MCFEGISYAKNGFCYKKITFNYFSDPLLGSASEDDEDDDNSTTSSVLKHHSIHGSLPPGPGETNNNSLPHSDISSTIGTVSWSLQSYNTTVI